MGRTREDFDVRYPCQKFRHLPGTVTPRDFGFSSISESVFLWLDVRTPSGKVKSISLRLCVADTVNWLPPTSLPTPSTFPFFTTNARICYSLPVFLADSGEHMILF